ncbi:uncharacterized protein LOC119702049 [Motacilla alba alba]|uniref:uncharacterized protein LOC119702049 n=1 Tax=Motacilla alba alba TaxID=1094192 RepID=UPI0018D5587C|nr:uncharacterized protein LOC119702049 [Motacilla alba alba]
MGQSMSPALSASRTRATTPWLPVRPPWDTDEAMSVLLPSLVLLVASTAVLLATRVWKARKRLGSRAGGSRCRQAAPGAPGSPRAGESPPCSAESRLYIPCSCGPCCTPCATAARELQDLVAPLWPEVSFPRDSEMWQLSWEDLEQLLERGHLPCCASSSSSSSSESLQLSTSPTRPLICRKTSAAGKGSVLRRTRRCLRSSPLPRMSIPRKGSSIPIQALCDLCCAPTGTWPVPAKKQEEVSWSRRCPIHGSQDPAAEPSGQTLRALLDKRLQRQRQLFPSQGCSLELTVKDKDKEDLPPWDIYSKGLHPCQSLHEICWTPDGEAHTDRSPCCLGAVAIHKTQQRPKARESLEIQLGAQAAPAKHSQQQVSLSRRCPMHGSQRAAVPQEKTLWAALDKRLQRQLEHQGALRRWLSRIQDATRGSSWHTP